MELEGHPTQDLVEELARRGAMIFSGGTGGPDPDQMELARRRQDQRGQWIFLPLDAYETGFDEQPPIQ